MNLEISAGSSSFLQKRESRAPGYPRVPPVQAGSVLDLGRVCRSRDRGFLGRFFICRRCEFQEQPMIKIIEGFPDNIVGIVVKGRVTKKDCSDVLLPALEKSLVWHHKLRLYYEIRSRYPGAAWEEINLGIEPSPFWERVAVVS